MGQGIFRGQGNRGNKLGGGFWHAGEYSTFDIQYPTSKPKEVGRVAPRAPQTFEIEYAPVAAGQSEWTRRKYFPRARHRRPAATGAQPAGDELKSAERFANSPAMTPAPQSPAANCLAFPQTLWL
jgi:hypothetical protein